LESNGTNLCNEEVRRITKQPNLTAIIQSRRLSVFGHIARMDDDAGAKMILMAPLPENWKRPPGRPCSAWLNTVQRDLRAYNRVLTLLAILEIYWNYFSSWKSWKFTGNLQCFLEIL